jgi:hypothetical protein
MTSGISARVADRNPESYVDKLILAERVAKDDLLGP